MIGIVPRARFAASLVAIALTTPLAACAGILGFEDGVPVDAADATSDAPGPDALILDASDASRADSIARIDGPGDDAATMDGSGDVDGGASSDATSDGAPGADAGDARADDASDGGDPCTTTIADPSAAIFVAGSGNDGPACGTPSNPCLTIQTGLDRASADGLAVVDVQQGSYAESISLRPGVTVVGGWRASWVKDTMAGADALVVLQPTVQSATVVATQLSESARLCTLTVLSKSQAAAGESLYGVFATGPGAALQLDDVVIVVGSGGNGQAGDGGASAGNASSAGCSPADGGSAVPTGDAGAPATAGTFTSQGYAPASGSTGYPGFSGNAGVAAGAPPCVTCYGGCSALCGGTGATTECGQKGASGCGGLPGLPGAGGGGGGSSVGVFAWQTSVIITGGQITTGNGGSGALGGGGSAGGAGAQGVTGAPGASCTVGCSSCGLACCSSVAGQPAGGAPGGPGGSGSAGGNGGGGAGGSSCATAAGGDAGTVLTTSTAVMTGDAGQGAGGAASGTSSTECH